MMRKLYGSQTSAEWEPGTSSNLQKEFVGNGNLQALLQFDLAR